VADILNFPNWSDVSLPAGATFSPEFNLTPAYAPSADYQNAIDSISPGVSGMVTQQAQASGTDWMTSLANLVGVLAIGEQQRNLLKVQVDRASKGLPPLNTSQYTAGASVGISSDTKLFLGLSVAAVLAVMLLRRR